MAADDPRGALFRPLVGNRHSRVTYAELFFDLVFVFAVTQISHTLLDRFTPLGAIQTSLLFLAVRWVLAVAIAGPPVRYSTPNPDISSPDRQRFRARIT